MKIAVFGGTGVVGNYIINQLLSAGYDVNVLVRNESKNKLEKIKKCNVISGDISHAEAIDATLKNCNAVIYNIGIIREFKSEGITFENLHYQGLKSVVDNSKKYHILELPYAP